MIVLIATALTVPSDAIISPLWTTPNAPTILKMTQWYGFKNGFLQLCTTPNTHFNNRSVSCKLKYLQNIKGHQLTVVVHIWLLFVQKPMRPKTTITIGAQTMPNFLIIRTEWWSIIHRLPADVQMAVMHSNISKNHRIFCRHVDHKCYYEAKWIKYTGVVIASSIAVG